MREKQINENELSEWAKDESDVAALVMRQWLEPVEGKEAVIFPPTYPIDSSKAGYNIDRFDDGTSVCQIDSVGSQANRIEPIFKRNRYRHLVPQVTVKADETDVDLLDAGHRAADAIVRFSTLGPKLHDAFSKYQREGNAEPLARIAPTSIVFGSWDSRATQAKLPRIVRSVIRAYNVKELTRSAQYSTIAGEILEGGEAEVTTKGRKAELGLAHVPAVRTHGGIQVEGEIRREAILNLSALRALAATDEEGTRKLRRYILGLCLVSFTAPLDLFLREGCQLVPTRERKPEWKLVKHDGSRVDCHVTLDEALGLATRAAKEFGVNTERISGDFDPRLASKFLKLSDKKAKELLRNGPVTMDILEKE